MRDRVKKIKRTAVDWWASVRAATGWAGSILTALEREPRMSDAELEDGHLS
jgi:hypothetical protein